ncbi:ribonuclease p protein component [hydrocarbon metagenome]|uniref:Ribonuclease p protein component n=1 Tax=hydrocarbon metagenome TaxID=938273 RepID=A0A0W8E1T6_9ZZZZ
MLKKEYRINKKKEYNNIYKKGKKIPGRYMVVFIIAGDKACSRYGFVASKKVGNAVHRNRAKRRLRTIVYRNMSDIKDSVDVVIVARPAINEASLDEVNNEYIRVMRKAGLC